MADDQLTLTIDESGTVVIENRAVQQRLARRPGKYRLVPSAQNLVVLERVADGEQKSDGYIILSGDIGATGGLVDIIHFIATNNWSGQLAVMSSATRKTIYFKQGEVSTAASNVPEDKIGAILYRFGMITAQDLERALAQVTQDHRFGQVLVENGTLTAHDLYQYVRKQIEEIFHSVLVLRSGEYYFYRTADDAGPPSQLQLSTKTLLFEGVRRIDEMGYFREKIPSSEAVFAQKQPQPNDKLGPREARLLSLVDGVRDVSTIARESHLGEFDTTKVLYQLIQSGHVMVVQQRQRVTGTMPQLDTQATDDPRRAHSEVVDLFNKTYVKIHATVGAKGKLQALERGRDSFFSSVSEFAPLFVGVGVGVDGSLDKDVLLANLEMAPSDNKLDYLHRGLNELLSFELFTAGEAVDRREEQELHQRLNQILRDMPAEQKQAG